MQQCILDLIFTDTTQTVNGIDPGAYVTQMVTGNFIANSFALGTLVTTTAGKIGHVRAPRGEGVTLGRVDHPRVARILRFGNCGYKLT
jgi:hypothetical protein